MAKDKVKAEKERLESIFSTMPANEFAVAAGLIDQAARMRVQLDKLHADIKKNGLTEMFSQSDKTDPYSRERPEARLYIAIDKNYQAIIKQLLERCPPSVKENKFARFTSGG